MVFALRNLPSIAIFLDMEALCEKMKSYHFLISPNFKNVTRVMWSQNT